MTFGEVQTTMYVGKILVNVDKLIRDIKSTKFSARRSKAKVLEFLNKVAAGEDVDENLIKYVSNRAPAISDLAPFMDSIKSILNSVLAKKEADAALQKQSES